MSGTNIWDATAHPRQHDGRWAEAAGSAPEHRLEHPDARSTVPAITAYRTAPIPEGAGVTIDDDGDDQDCSCGNGTWANWWASGLPDGTLSLDAVGGSDPQLTCICPRCGAVYRLDDLDYGTTTAPIGRFDPSDDAFARALDHQHRMLFGTPRRPDNRITLDTETTPTWTS